VNVPAPVLQVRLSPRCGCASGSAGPVRSPAHRRGLENEHERESNPGTMQTVDAEGPPHAASCGRKLRAARLADPRGSGVSPRSISDFDAPRARPCAGERHHALAALRILAGGSRTLKRARRFGQNLFDDPRMGWASKPIR